MGAFPHTPRALFNALLLVEQGMRAENNEDMFCLLLNFFLKKSFLGSKYGLRGSCEHSGPVGELGRICEFL